MPYIKSNVKEEMRDAIHELFRFIKTKGELNYVICELVGKLIFEENLSYKKISEWIDAVHDAEEELRRRILTPYEVTKMIENGDVPSFKVILDRIISEKKG
jgi:tRNA1(Val) A37 N6-methylase TrmN6